MTNQAAHERVKRLIIEPLKSLFNAKIDTYAENVFYEDLSHFTEQCLTETMKQIRQTRKRSPVVGEIIAIANVIENSLDEKTARKPFVRQESQTFPAEAEEVIKSEFGQMALREGWGSSLYLKTLRSGFVAWRETHAVEFRAARLEAIQAAQFADIRRTQRTDSHQGGVFAKDGGFALNSALFSIWEGMEKREAKMREKYLAA